MKELKNITDKGAIHTYRQLAYRINGPIAQLGRGSNMPTINEELAEMLGALIGDGCISRYKTKEGRIRTFLLFTGHSKNDLCYYEEVVNPIFKKEFGGKGRLYIRKDVKSLTYWVGSKKAINYFISLGFPIGRKPENIKIMPTISNEIKLMKACVRGIFNTDGSVYRRYSKRYNGHSKTYANYAVIQFKLKSRPLLVQIRKLLRSSNYKPNRITRVDDVYVLRITNQDDVHRFMTEFAINHPYHLERYRSIVLPPKASDS